jgi:hypothetical protein
MLKGIDTANFRGLVGDAVSDSELFSFFRQNQKKLTQAGSKLDNLPRDKRTGLEIISRMNDKALRIFKSYLESVIPEDETLTAQEAAENFRRHTLSTDPPEVNAIRPLARSVLIHVLSDPIPAEIATLFVGVKVADEAIDEKRSGEDRRNLPSVLPESAITELRELAFQIIGVEVQGEIADVSADALAYLEGLRALKKEDVRSARSAQERMSATDIRVGLLEDAIEHVLARIALGSRRIKGLEIEPFVDRESIANFNPESYEFLGICTDSVPDHPTKPAFIEVMAVRIGDHWCRLSLEQLREWIPDEGRLIAYANKKVSRPWRDEVGVWAVEHFDTSNDIKYRLRAKTSPVYEVFDLPFSSTDVDGLREAIRKHRVATHTRPIFRTADGLLIRVPKEAFEFATEGFDEPLHVWTLVGAIEWKGRRFVIGGLPAPEARLDCRELDRVLPSMVYQAARVAGISMSRSQANELIDAVIANRDSADPLRTKAIAKELDVQISNIANLQAIVEALLTHPRLIAEIQRAKSAAVESALKERADLSAEIGQLKIARANVEKEIREKKTECQGLPAQVSKQVKAAFENAARDGVEILGQVGLLSAFMRPEIPPSAAPLLAAQPSRDDLAVSISETPRVLLRRVEVEAETVLLNAGIAKRDAGHFESAIRIVLEAGLVPVLSGVMANSIARFLAPLIAKKGAISFYVAAGENVQLIPANEISDPNRGWDTVLLQNFNLSPQEYYGAALFEAITSQIALGTSLTVNAIATLSKGIAGLQISPEIRSICVFFDFEKGRPAASINDVTEWQHALSDDSDDGTTSRPWRIAVKRIASVLGELKSQPSPEVLSILEIGFRPSPSDPAQGN